MYAIERKPWYRPWRPYRWELILSSHGAAWGSAWTRRGCERALLMEQGRMFGG